MSNNQMISAPKLLAADNDRDMLEYLSEGYESQVYVCEQCGHEEPLETYDLASDLREYLAAYPHAPAGQHQGEPVALGIPDECPHLIVFDDAAVGQILFAGSGARSAALKKWESISVSWNAHLFVRVARNSRDDGHPCATAADPAEVEQLRDALDECDGERWKLRSERDTLRAQLAERDALLARVVNSGALSREQFEALEGECCAIPTRAPKCETCHDQGEVHSGKMADQGYNQPPEPIMEACPDCKWGAPVEVDERGQPVAWMCKDASAIGLGSLGIVITNAVKDINESAGVDVSSFAIPLYSDQKAASFSMEKEVSDLKKAIELREEMLFRIAIDGWQAGLHDRCDQSLFNDSLGGMGFTSKLGFLFVCGGGRYTETMDDHEKPPAPWQPNPWQITTTFSFAETTYSSDSMNSGGDQIERNEGIVYPAGLEKAHMQFQEGLISSGTAFKIESHCSLPRKFGRYWPEEVQQQWETRAPVCETCSNQGAVGNILNAEPCPDCSYSAPVERDERAEFEKVIAQKWPGIRMLRIYRPGAPANGEYELPGLEGAWQGWQARADLERKP